jgi:hypothetical protein
MLDRRTAAAAEVPVVGRIPADVDTDEDYRALLASVQSVA